MPTQTRSHATSDGKAYFKNAGRYNEFTKDAMKEFINDATSAMKQKNLAQSGKNTGAARSTNKAKHALGL